MKTRSRIVRKAVDVLVKGLTIFAACLGSGVFVWILLEILSRGALSIHWDFFSTLPAPHGAAGGGVVNALAGTVALMVGALVLSLPIGLPAGVYLAEFDRGTHCAACVRLLVNILTEIPPVLIGVFVFLLVVGPGGAYSGYAGSLALAMLLAPSIAKTTETSLRSVPESLREASVSIGASRRHTVRFVLFRAARTRLLRGMLCAVVRVCGLTSPLLFSALNSPDMLKTFSEPTANVTVTIFQYALSPAPERIRIAWGIALLILISVSIVSLGEKLFLQEKK